MAELYVGRHIQRDDCSCGHAMPEHTPAMPAERALGTEISSEFICLRCNHIADVRSKSSGALERYALNLSRQSKLFIAKKFSDLDLVGATIVGYEEGTFAIVATAYNRMAEVKRLIGRTAWSHAKEGGRRAKDLMAYLGDVRDEFERRASSSVSPT